MEKKTETAGSGGQEHGWRWGRAKLQSEDDLAAVLGRVFDLPLSPLSWQGKVVLDPEAVEAWLNKRRWVGVSLRDEGWCWMKSEAGGTNPRAAKPDEVKAVWGELEAWSAALEAAEIASGHEAPKTEKKKRKRM